MIAHELNLPIYTAQGIAKFLRDLGIEWIQTGRVPEDDIHAMDMIEAGIIDMVINISREFLETMQDHSGNLLTIKSVAPTQINHRTNQMKQTIIFGLLLVFGITTGVLVSPLFAQQDMAASPKTTCFVGESSSARAAARR